jgi:hypothetical protein
MQTQPARGPRSYTQTHACKRRMCVRHLWLTRAVVCGLRSDDFQLAVLESYTALQSFDGMAFDVALRCAPPPSCPFLPHIGGGIRLMWRPPKPWLTSRPSALAPHIHSSGLVPRSCSTRTAHAHASLAQAPAYPYTHQGRRPHCCYGGLRMRVPVVGCVYLRMYACGGSAASFSRRSGCRARPKRLSASWSALPPPIQPAIRASLSMQVRPACIRTRSACVLVRERCTDRQRQ